MLLKTVKPIFTDKNRNKETITLIVKNEIVSDELKVAQTFVNIVFSLVKISLQILTTRKILFKY